MACSRAITRSRIRSSAPATTARIAKDALALFPEGESKQALVEVVDFCVARAH